jgi:hypothetical protein
MKCTSGVQIVRAGAVCLALLGLTSGAALPQTIGSENPKTAPADVPAPAADCQPIGLTVSGEAVFPFQCKDFLERQKTASQKTAAEAKKKRTAADKKADVAEGKTGAKKQETAAPENSKPATEIVGTIPLPRVRERIVGPAGCVHFHSYDAASGTYRSFDRRRRPCREVMSAATTTKDGPPALLSDSSKGPPQPTDSTEAVDTNSTAANKADPRSSDDVETRKIEADVAPATTPPDSSKAQLRSADSTAAVDTNAASANKADPPSAVDVDAKKIEADVAPATTPPDSAKAQLQSADSTAAVDTNAASANRADPPSTVDVGAKKIEADVAPATTPPPDSSKAQLQSADSTAAVDTNAASANKADPPSTVDVDAKKIGADVAPATTPTEHSTVATAVPPPDVTETASILANGTDHLVAVLLARPEITSVSALTGKTIAIDDRYSASNGSVRIAIVAAGASEIELSAGRATAMSRLINGEVPAAILALLPADAAEGVHEIAGFKILRIPLSPHS